MPEPQRVQLQHRFLDQLLTTYFGPDWYDDYADEDLAIEDFLRSKDFQLEGVLDDLTRFREAALSASEYERLFAHLCRWYIPDGEPTPYRYLADKIENRVATALAYRRVGNRVSEDGEERSS